MTERLSGTLAAAAKHLGALVVLGGALALAAPALAGKEPAPKKAETAAEAEPQGRLRLVVSLTDQKVDVYRGLEVIESSRVSTGKAGHSTPAGVYSILQKSRWHRSNIYSSAPMPFMQRITWSGIALHEGHVPNYPASHGCIRLPGQFARKLFSMTGLGVDVIVVDRHAAFEPIDDDALFQPAGPPRVASAAPMPRTPDAASMEFADFEAQLEMMRAWESRSPEPLRILVTRRTGRERLMDLQRMLKELGHDPGEIDGWLGGNTGAAIQSFQESIGAPRTGMVTEELYAQLHEAVGRPEITGHLYVRQKHVDLFDAPVAIRDDAAPLGTHVFAVRDFEDTADEASWAVLTMTDPDMGSAKAALDRIDIPESLRRRVAFLLTSGSTFIISDAGLGRETGKGTDFIVQPGAWSP